MELSQRKKSQQTNDLKYASVFLLEVPSQFSALQGAHKML